MNKENKLLIKLNKELEYLNTIPNSTIFDTENVTNLNILKNIYNPLIYTQMNHMYENKKRLLSYIPNLAKIVPVDNMNEQARLLIPARDCRYHSRINKLEKQMPYLYIDSNGVVKANCPNNEYDRNEIHKMLSDMQKFLENMILDGKNNPLNIEYNIMIDNMLYPEIKINKSLITASNDYDPSRENNAVLSYRFYDDDYGTNMIKSKSENSEIKATINQIFDHILIPYDSLPHFVKYSTKDSTQLTKMYGPQKRQ